MRYSTFSSISNTIRLKKGPNRTSLVVQRLGLHLPMQEVASSIPGEGARILHASWSKNQNLKQKKYCNKFNKDFENGLYPKNLREGSQGMWPRVLLMISYFKKFFCILSTKIALVGSHTVFLVSGH